METQNATFSTNLKILTNFNSFFSLELSESDEEAPQESNIAAAFDGPTDLFGNISDLSDED